MEKMDKEKLYKDANEKLSLRRSAVPISAVRTFLKDFKESLLEKISINREDSTKWADNDSERKQKNYELPHFVILNCKEATLNESLQGKHYKPIIVHVNSFESNTNGRMSYAGVGWGEGNNPQEAYEDLLSVLDRHLSK